MKLVDLEQQIFVPVVDETHGGATVEMGMTVGEFFEKCCAGFAPEIIKAIPVEWLKGLMLSTEDDVDKVEFAWIMRKWESEQKEQEAR